MSRLSARLQALLSLVGVAVLPLTLGIFAAEKAAPLPPEAEELSHQAAKALEGGGLFALIVLGVGILIVTLVWRHAGRAVTSLQKSEPASWMPVRVALLTLTWLVGQALASVPLALALLHPSLAGWLSPSLVIGLAWLFGAGLGLLLPLWFAFRGRFPGAGQVGLCLPNGGREFFWGFLAFLTFPALVFLGSAVTSQIGEFDPFRTNPVFSAALSSASKMDWVLLFLLVALFGPALEEFLFRGLLYRSLRNLWPAGSAILISAFFFSAVHPTPATLLPVALLGMVLAYLYERTGSIVPGMVAHGLYNGSALAALVFLQRTAM